MDFSLLPLLWRLWPCVTGDHSASSEWGCENPSLLLLPATGLPCWVQGCSVFVSPHAVAFGGCCESPWIIFFLPSPLAVRCWRSKWIVALLREFCLLVVPFGLGALLTKDDKWWRTASPMKGKEHSSLILGNRAVETSALGSHQEWSRKRNEQSGA